MMRQFGLKLWFNMSQQK